MSRPAQLEVEGTREPALYSTYALSKVHIEGETMRKRAAADKQNTGSKSKKFD